jgi:hypothetical protein
VQLERKKRAEARFFLYLVSTNGNTLGRIVEFYFFEHATASVGAGLMNVIPPPQIKYSNDVLAKAGSGIVCECNRLPDASLRRTVALSGFPGLPGVANARAWPSASSNFAVCPEGTWISNVTGVALSCCNEPTNWTLAGIAANAGAQRPAMAARTALARFMLHLQVVS